MSEFNHRVLEIHSVHAFDFPHVVKCMDFAAENGLTAICFHRNDFVDKLVYPASLVGGTKEYDTASAMYGDLYQSMYKNDPLHRDMPCRSGVYFRLVLSEAKKRGLGVFIENKELSFPDYIELLHPEIRKNGALCPCEPFFITYLREKYKELFRLYPGISGIITSLSTSESRASFAVNHCGCDLCKSKTAKEWYDEIIGAMYEPIHAAGSRLVIRDFVFDKKAHDGVADAFGDMPPDIIFSLKNTPHDYYPTFPDNRRIGKTPRHRQWIEYDVLGQYYGLGIGVAVMHEDIRRRLAFAKENGVDGVLIRTCWEGLYGISVFDTPNLLSLYALSMLANRADSETDEMYDRWLRYRAFYRAGATEGDRKAAIQGVRAVLDGSWDVLRRAAYMNDCVYNDSSCYPAGLEQGFWLGEVKNSLRDWLPAKRDAMEAGSEENIRHILAEKDEALRLVGVLCENAGRLGRGLTDEAARYLRGCVEAYRYYVRGYRYFGGAAILTRYFTTQDAAKNPRLTAFARETLAERLDGLAAMAEEFEGLWAGELRYFFQTYLVLDPERMRFGREDFLRHLAGTAYYA